MRTAAAVWLLLAPLAGCSRAPSADPDVQLKRLAEAVAAFEDAVEAGADKDRIVGLAERAHRASDLIPDDAWTDDQRRRLLDLLKTFDATFSRWESGEPAREVEPGLT